MVRTGQPETLPTHPEPTPPIVKEEGPLATGERFRPVALAGLTVILVALCILLAVPFVPAITWGVALAIIAWPLGAWVRRHVTANRTWAAFLTSAVVIAAIVVPTVYVGKQLAQEAASSTEQMRQDQAQTTFRDRLAGVPQLGSVVAWIDRAQVDLDAEVRAAAQSYFGNGMWLATGSLMFLFQMAIAVYILFYVLRDGELFQRGVRRLLPVTREEADRVFERAAGSVHANLYAALVTSLIDAALGGLLFWALGLPAPVLWGVVIFVLSMLPVAGIVMVWVPAAVYLGLVGQWGGVVAMVAWGVGCSVLVDTLLYTRLAGGRMRLHPVPMLLAYVGGLAVFGASGIVLGPAILAVTVAVLEVWHARATNTELPPPDDAKGAKPAQV